MEEVDRNRLMGSMRPPAAKLDAVAWGVFLIWLGIAVLADVGWGVGLLGVGLITLGAQAVRKSFGLPLEWFWLATGTMFSVWGIWELLRSQLGEAPIGLLPVLCIAIGVVAVLSALLHESRP